jgi:nucleotide-binding universal stress UspA family protein
MKMKTTKIKKVLIAMDYAETAQIIAEKGFSMAKAMNAETILMHVVSEHPVYYSGYSYMRELQVDVSADLRKSTQEFLDKLKKHLGDPAVKTVLKDSVDVAGTILSTAKALDVDLIVMGSHSRKWLENIIMGSEVEEVLRKTTIPLYIIPTKKQKE